MKTFIFISTVLFGLIVHGQNTDPTNYLSDLKIELQREWPKNRIINTVFHMQSVPAGYFKTAHLNTLSAYPYLFLNKLKSIYPYAGVNIIVTAIAGENAVEGAERFEGEVFASNPDVLFIDYTLIDRCAGLEEAYMAWNQMITLAIHNEIKVILLTPSPDQLVNYNSPDNELKKHTNQIIRLAKENQVALVDSYKVFGFLYSDKEQLEKYLSQANHPSEIGHELISNEIL